MLISALEPRYARFTAPAPRSARSGARWAAGAAFVTVLGAFGAAAAQPVTVKCHSDNLTVHKVPLEQAQGIVPAEHRGRVGADADGMATVQIYTCDGVIGGADGRYSATIISRGPPFEGGTSSLPITIVFTYRPSVPPMTPSQV